MQEQIKKDLFDNNLFIDDADGIKLRGSRCMDCNKSYFPPRNKCPDCLQSDLPTLPLAREGSLYSYTTVNIPSKNFPPPYVVGYVELKEGIRIFGQLRVEKGRKLALGQHMKMVVDYLWEDKEGRKAAGYLFETDNA